MRQRQPHILVGVTSPQTCLVLPGRLRALRDAGFKVSLLSAPGELLEQTARSEQVEAFAIPMERGISPFRDIVALIRIWRLLQRVRPDIVEFSTPKAGLLGTLAARLSGIPVRIYLLRGLKLETSRSLRRLLLLWAERVASGSADIVVCNSRSLREQALAIGIAPGSKLVLVGEGSSNGVNLARFAPGSTTVRMRFGIPHDAPVIGFSGRLTADKGLPELLEAFAAILRRAVGCVPASGGLVRRVGGCAGMRSESTNQRASSDHLHRLCGRHRSLLPRHGPDGTALMAGGLSQRSA